MAELNRHFEDLNSSTSLSDPPINPPDSPGSSVSTRFQDEYNELLQCAVTMPSYHLGTELDQNYPNPEVMTGLQNLLRTHQEEREHWNRDRGDGEKFYESEQKTPPKSVKRSYPKATADSPELYQARSQAELLNSPRASRAESGHDGVETAVQYFEHVPAHKLSSKVTSHPVDDRDAVSHPTPVPSSLSSSVIVGDDFNTDPSGFDSDLGKMGQVLDKWCTDLRRTVMAEFSQTKIKSLEHARQQLLKQAERHASEKNQLRSDIDHHKELLHTYEKSLERKDQIICNLTEALKKHKDKVDKMRAFCEWKVQMVDAKREGFTVKLAERQHVHCLKRRVWAAWRSILENKWRERVERVCQRKAQDVCMSLTDEYEGKINELNEQLKQSHQDVQRLSAERQMFEEHMKQAFMRGVSALNLEALSMFGDAEAKGGAACASAGVEVSQPTARTLLSEPCYPAGPVAHASKAHTNVLTSSKSITVGYNRKEKTRAPVNKLATTKVDSGKGKPATTSSSTTLHPPIAAVVVERHPPTTKSLKSNQSVKAHQPPNARASTSFSSLANRPCHSIWPSECLIHQLTVKAQAQPTTNTSSQISSRLD